MCALRFDRVLHKSACMHACVCVYVYVSCMCVHTQMLDWQNCCVLMDAVHVRSVRTSAVCAHTISSDIRM